MVSTFSTFRKGLPVLTTKRRWYYSILPQVTVGMLLLLIIGAATFLRFYQIGKLSFWEDEIFTAKVATLSLKDMFQALWPSRINMDLYFVLVHYWVKIFPDASEGTLRSISGIFSVASIPVVFLLGRALGANRAQAVAIGLIAALLVTVNAWHIQYGQELRSYSLVFLLATLSTFLLMKAVEQPSSPIRWVGYAIVSAAAVHAHLLAVLVLIAQAASLLVLLWGSVRTFPFKETVGSGIAIGVLVAPLVVAVIMPERVDLIAWIPELTLNRIKNFTIALTGNQGGLLLVLYLLGASIGLGVGARAWLRGENLVRKWKFTLMASCLFLPVAIALVFSMAMKPIFVNKYLLFVMPYLAILAAVGIVTLTSFKWERLAFTPILGTSILLTAVALSATGVKAYFEDFQKDDFREVAQFLAKECSEDLRLYHSERSEAKITYYNADLKSQIPRLKWRDKLNEKPSAEELADFLPDGYSRACLMLWRGAANPEVRDQTRVIRSALRTKFAQVATVDFYGMKVETYAEVNP